MKINKMKNLFNTYPAKGQTDLYEMRIDQFRSSNELDGSDHAR